ncbi:MAG: TIGR04282 family arsenosugar biosynthesis glycosyltransferase [Planctomycetes bacterium]|nr:TIGR04282 family arsenosugar biosynthesis glycosyltransferase [Planctomycetota bacterium]
MFAKYWELGEVKTRLAATLGNDSASEIYRSFVSTLVQRFSHRADRRVLCFTPEEHADSFRAFAGQDWIIQSQSTGDLGSRMTSFFDSCFREDAERVVLIGSDSPSMPVEYVDSAFGLLRETDVVLGPTDDGGYYLVGVSRAGTAIFEDIDWSTPRVWEQTIARIGELRLSYESLPQWYDVDESADLERLRNELLQIANDDPALSELLAAINRIL